eukprot:7244236-Pyramimonas_sp.AAC.1
MGGPRRLPPQAALVHEQPASGASMRCLIDRPHRQAVSDRLPSRGAPAGCARRLPPTGCLACCPRGLPP